MIQGKKFGEKIAHKMGLKPFEFSFENLKALTSIYHGIVFTTYWYDHGIDKQFTWIEEMSEYSFFATRNEAYIHNCMVIQRLLNKMKNHKKEKRFYIGKYRNVIYCYIYTRDVLRRDFYFIFYGENDIMPPIYILSLHENFNKSFGFFGIEKTVGFFYNKKEAIDALNVKHINNNKLFNYASISKCYQGYDLLTTDINVYRYKRDKNKFFTIITPKVLINDEDMNL